MRKSGTKFFDNNGPLFIPGSPFYRVVTKVAQQVQQFLLTNKLYVGIRVQSISQALALIRPTVEYRAVVSS